MYPVRIAFPHYHIARSGVVTVAITRRRSPADSKVKPFAARGKYRVKLTDGDGTRHSIYVHELVSQTYAARQPEDDERIAFIDGDKLNPHFENLMLVSTTDTPPEPSELVPAIREEILLGHRGKLAPLRRPDRTNRRVGTNNGNAILTDEAAMVIRYYCRGRFTQQEIADRFMISQSTVSQIMRGETWSHVRLDPKLLPRETG